MAIVTQTFYFSPTVSAGNVSYIETVFLVGLILKILCDGVLRYLIH